VGGHGRCVLEGVHPARRRKGLFFIEAPVPVETGDTTKTGSGGLLLYLFLRTAADAVVRSRG
jgi:hypothetical protein